MSDTTNESHLNFMKGMESCESRLGREAEHREQNAKNRMSFGVSFLDEALGGIYNNDLVVLGAKTGLGKSQLAMLIALENARQGKRVHFFALEAEEYEIERRIKYQLIADKFYKMPNRPNIHLNYMDWYYNKFSKELESIEKEIEEEEHNLSTLNIYYRQVQFDIQEFERLAFGVKDQTDLMIIDHLHYFDHDDENENRAIKQIVKRIRDCALISGKPIILVAHVRKSDRRLKQLIPDIEDFHGSSDIGKIGVKVITIAPCYEEVVTTHRKTFFQILKCRVDGSRMNMTGLLGFNINNQRYEKQYKLGRLSYDGTDFKPFNFNEMPFWAINALPGKAI